MTAPVSPTVSPTVDPIANTIGGSLDRLLENLAQFNAAFSAIIAAAAGDAQPSETQLGLLAEIDSTTGRLAPPYLLVTSVPKADPSKSRTFVVTAGDRVPVEQILVTGHQRIANHRHVLAVEQAAVACLTEVTALFAATRRSAICVDTLRHNEGAPLAWSFELDSMHIVSDAIPNSPAVRSRLGAAFAALQPFPAWSGAGIARPLTNFSFKCADTVKRLIEIEKARQQRLENGFDPTATNSQNLGAVAYEIFRSFSPSEIPDASPYPLDVAITAHDEAEAHAKVRAVMAQVFGYAEFS